MSCIELVVLILVIGFVSMVEICAITICVGKTLDTYTKGKMEMGIKAFEKEMDYFDKLLTKFLDGLDDVINKKENK